MGTLLIVLLVLVVVGVGTVVTYNRLVADRLLVDGGLAQIDVQLNRRSDLVLNLVQTVKGYAAHERETIEGVIAARAMGNIAETPGDKAAAGDMLTGALSKLFALSEAYPDLKANQGFLQLQEELTATEDRVAYARQAYNEHVRTYNTSIQKFPAVFVARLTGFTQREFFEVDTPATRGVPTVRF